MKFFDNDDTKVFALGGLGEVGKNMYCVMHDDEIIIVDTGVMFPEDGLLGIDYVIPDFTFLKTLNSFTNSADASFTILGLFIHCAFLIFFNYYNSFEYDKPILAYVFLKINQNYQMFIILDIKTIYCVRTFVRHFLLYLSNKST